MSGAFIGDIMSTAFDQTMDNAWNANAMMQSKIQFGKQYELAKNPYPYAVESLKEAGLNPILAVGGGVKGGSLSANSAKVSTGRSNLGMAANTSARANMENAATNRRLMESTEDLNETKGQTERKLQGKLEQEKKLAEELTNKASSDANLASAQALKTAQDTIAQELDNVRRKVFSGMYGSKIGKYIPYVETLLKLLGTGLGAAAAGKYIFPKGSQKVIPMDKNIVPGYPYK